MLLLADGCAMGAACELNAARWVRSPLESLRTASRARRRELTPEEIKQRLARYTGGTRVSKLCRAALSYIQELEARAMLAAHKEGQ